MWKSVIRMKYQHCHILLDVAKSMNIVYIYIYIYLCEGWHFEFLNQGHDVPLSFEFLNGGCKDMCDLSLTCNSMLFTQIYMLTDLLSR